MCEGAVGPVFDTVASVVCVVDAHSSLVIPQVVATLSVSRRPVEQGAPAEKRSQIQGCKEASSQRWGEKELQFGRKCVGLGARWASSPLVYRQSQTVEGNSSPCTAPDRGHTL